MLEDQEHHPQPPTQNHRLSRRRFVLLATGTTLAVACGAQPFEEIKPNQTGYVVLYLPRGQGQYQTGKLMIYTDPGELEQTAFMADGFAYYDPTFRGQLAVYLDQSKIVLAAAIGDNQAISRSHKEAYTTPASLNISAKNSLGVSWTNWNIDKFYFNELTDDVQTRRSLSSGYIKRN